MPEPQPPRNVATLPWHETDRVREALLKTHHSSTKIKQTYWIRGELKVIETELPIQEIFNMSVPTANLKSEDIEVINAHHDLQFTILALMLDYKWFECNEFIDFLTNVCTSRADVSKGDHGNHAILATSMRSENLMTGQQSILHQQMTEREGLWAKVPLVGRFFQKPPMRPMPYQY